MLVQAISYWEFKDKRANSVDPDEVAQNEPPHQDLRCVQIQLFSSMVVKELRVRIPVKNSLAFKAFVALAPVDFSRLYG